MRDWCFTSTLLLLLLLLLSPHALSQQQYSEAACILLQQQIDRFSNQPQLSAYQDSKRQFDKHCQNPIPAPDKPLVLTNTPAKPAAPAADAAAVASSAAATGKFDMGAMMLSLFTPYIPYIVGVLLLLILPGLLITLIFGNRARFLGAKAERQLYRLLVRDLPAGYKHYRNVILETAQGDLTEVDYLVLSPVGIFVIEVKNYQGGIVGSEHQPQWTVQHPRRKISFQNPLQQNLKHTAAVKFTLGIGMQDGKTVYSVVAFSDRAEFKTLLPAQVCNIPQVAAYIQQYTAPCFSDELLRQFASKLNLVAKNQRALRKAHFQQVRNRRKEH